jgi:polyphosphate glucokinase
MNDISTILSFDIGGTGIKAALIDPSGHFLSDRIRIDTPAIKSPRGLVSVLDKVARQLPKFSVISVGFPGMIQDGEIRCSPTLKTKKLVGMNLENALEDHFKVPVRVRNDAEMQALPVIEGVGVEIVLTLGTGFGFAAFENGRVGSHLEMSTHPLVDGKTYNEYLGDAALKKKGKKTWVKHVRYAIGVIEELTHYKKLYIGGGNAAHLKGRLDKSIELVSNDYGISGGAWAWKS